MDTPTPHVPSGHHLKPGNIASKLKDPKMLAILGVLTVAFALYIRHRNASPAAAPDGSSTPVVDSPAETQGVAPGADNSGDYGGYPDPGSVPGVDGSDGSDGTDATGGGSDGGVVGVKPGDSVYDPHTGKLVTAPGSKKPGKKKRHRGHPAGHHPGAHHHPGHPAGHHHPTGGNPPKTGPGAHTKPPKHKPHKASHPAQSVSGHAHKPPSGLVGGLGIPTSKATPRATQTHHDSHGAIPAHVAHPAATPHHSPPAHHKKH